ncbi:acyl-CoA thioesterase/bile acid-CoA:amino acid N-acyltransferase family protein [Umezawaea sp. Da 62-37]|uniref:acyl-CoA thioesterase/bile acid-CoA:amino acid N-acyltransferase family protein n=1 Tax=Umezawaea sp. Da 62-37 TaxID=3075927 RepID=UPI0028F7368B|nr:acyl-CoA thioesterase/bile acid-CoA:amino acid N-acyltransferase family protein [Umezawaea sp. Da 62-37]WNV90163.1 acyl-CoA thioesterase/bile acid-CoA:amino acid N-acyltransferase family protein [Umezawaea sp. Da 62-37]
MAEVVVDPQGAPLDTGLAVRVTGLPPDSPATITLTTGDRASRAVFVADERGVVDLTRHAPVEGDYAGVDPMGLFWSLAPTGRAAGATLLEVEGVGEVGIERRTLPEGVVRTEVDEDGLVGVLFAPDDDDDMHPGVIVLGGSEGGLHELDAALLAGHGFVALALAYFGAPGLPEGLVDVPLEYFGTAVSYLSARAGEIGVIGGSRGGEAALLIGASFPEVRAVVSVVGSGVVTQGVGPRANLLRVLQDEAAPWTWRGDRLPYLPCSVPDALRAAVVDDEPVALRQAFDLDDGVPEEAVIPVERIRGGVLLLSAGDDRNWPSERLSEIAKRRLDEHEHPFPYEHVSYPDAGHLIAGPPHRSATDVRVPGPGVTFEMGGTPSATAAARADAWRRSLKFFSELLDT